MAKSKLFAKAMAIALAFSMVCTPLSTSISSEAASKPKLSATKATVTVGATKKVTVKGVTTKKIKKTTWSVKSAKIAKLSSKKKNSVTVKGVKKGTTTVTAKVTVGKKSYKLNCKITVNAKKTPATKVPATQVPTQAPATQVPETQVPTQVPATEIPATPVPTLRPLQKVSVTPVPVVDADEFPESPVEPTVNPQTAVAFETDFENVAVGTKSTDAITGAGINGALLRGFDPDNGDLRGDYLEVVDGSELDEVESGAINMTNVLKCFRTTKTWQGIMFDFTDELEEGCSYTFTAKVYSPNQDLMCSYQLQTTEDTAVTFGNFGPNSSSKYKFAAGAWRDVSVTISIPDDKYYYGLYFESYDGKGTNAFYLDDVKITKTVANYRDLTLPSLKETLSDTFGVVGVGAGIASLFGKSASEFITSQYNAYTPGNEMKPDAVITSNLITLEEAEALGYIIPDSYASFEDNVKNDKVMVPKLNFETVDNILENCSKKGLKLRGHTLVWHEQTPILFFQQNFKTAANSSSKNYNTTEECMDARLEFYIKTVMDHVLKSEYADCLYAYDVVNEYLHSKGSSKDAKPTYWELIYNTADSSVGLGVTLRPNYVQKAFQFAHDMLVEYDRLDVKLFYNDFNCYQYPEDIVHLTDFINENGQICDGIGMQAHLNISETFHSATNFATALEVFRVNAPNLEIHITELDATMNPAVKTDQEQAAYYDQIMNALITNKKNGGNITALIIWSLYDGVSWRDQQKPCIFKGIYNPKSAFYAVIDSVEKYGK